MDNTDKIYKQSVLIPMLPQEQKRKKTVQKTAGEHLLCRLLPFRSVMVTSLKKIGISTAGLKFKTVVALFYNNFAHNKVNQRFINVSEFNNNIAFKIYDTDDITGDLAMSRNQLNFSYITEIVNQIIQVFRSAKDQYNIMESQGLQPEKLMTDENIYFALQTKKIENTLRKELTVDHYVKASELIEVIKIGLIIAIVIWLISEM